MYSQAELETKLSELIAKHEVPGAQLAVLDGDEIVESAAGVLSVRTGFPVTTDALFLPGSNWNFQFWYRDPHALRGAP